MQLFPPLMTSMNDFAHDTLAIGALFGKLVNTHPNVAEADFASWLSLAVVPVADKQFALNRWLACRNQPFVFIAPLESHTSPQEHPHLQQYTVYNYIASEAYKVGSANMNGEQAERQQQ
jgi:hypothetical protein